jgi:hypothetical protein
VGNKCVLSGGKWVSSYDGKVHTKDSGLDIDHVVPLAEAWRSGAWAWTSQERSNFANYIEQPHMLIAVTAAVNRGKGDKDISSWLPKKNVCQYLIDWVVVKTHFNLTIDDAEAKVFEKYKNCDGLFVMTKQSSAPSASSVPTVTSSSSPKASTNSYETSEIQLNSEKLRFGGSLEVKFRVKSNDLNPQPIYCLVDMVVNPFEASLVSGDKRDGIWSCERAIPSSPMERQSSGKYAVQILIVFSQNGQKDEIRKPIAVLQDASIPSPTPTTALVTPGAFCSPAGAMGKSSSGVSYTCKSSPSDSRNRWRQ